MKCSDLSIVHISERYYFITFSIYQIVYVLLLFSLSFMDVYTCIYG